MVDFFFIVSLYVSDLLNCNNVRYNVTIVRVPGGRATSCPYVRTEPGRSSTGADNIGISHQSLPYEYRYSTQ